MTSRYLLMSVPGKLEDGSDTGWFVLDHKTRKSRLIGDGDAGQRKAALEVVRLNEIARHGRAPGGE